MIYNMHKLFKLAKKLAFGLSAQFKEQFDCTSIQD